MQRPSYDFPKQKKFTDTTEFYELKDQPDFSRKSSASQNNTPPKSSFTIPSSSNLLENRSRSQSSNPVYAPPRLEELPSRENPAHSQSSHVSPRSLHCIVIADHIMDCPICSKFYRNYSPFYNITILIMALALMFLFIRYQKLTLMCAKHIPSTPVATFTSSS